MSDVPTFINPIDARLSTHEEVCSLRYESINARLKRIEGILIKTAGVMLVSMAGMVWSVIYHAK